MSTPDSERTRDVLADAPKPEAVIEHDVCEWCLAATLEFQAASLLATLIDRTRTAEQELLGVIDATTQEARDLRTALEHERAAREKAEGERDEARRERGEQWARADGYETLATEEHEARESAEAEASRLRAALNDFYAVGDELKKLFHVAHGGVASSPNCPTCAAVNLWNEAKRNHAAALSPGEGAVPEPEPEETNEFRKAAREQAFTIQEPYDGAGRRIIHSYLGGIGADWDLDKVLDLIDGAEEVRWTDSFLSHDLAVCSEGKWYAFQVKRPATSEENPSEGETPT